jgi:probable DNA metabolism protein
MAMVVEGDVTLALRRWRGTARTALQFELAPEQVVWADDGSATRLFGEVIGEGERTTFNVPRQFKSLAASVACHRDISRWSLLYELLWRVAHEEPHLLEIASDPLMHRLVRMHRSVRRAAHKMKAFVRFRQFEDEFVSWFEPAHAVVERTAPFFVERFPSMRWTILTPDGCARWDLEKLTVSAGIERHQAPATHDALEDLWRTYYAGTFNPARLNRDAMRAEMPQQYWKNLPEARMIAELTREAPARVTRMIAQTLSAPAPLPENIEARECAATPAPPSDHVAWDPKYDPGWREARRRAEVVEHRWPSGLTVGGCEVLAGVAGWTDPSILAKGVFYPDNATSAEDRLRFYATQLPMVEVDATYYALPSEETSRRWVERTPAHFVFNIKAHSLMTGHPTDPARLPQWLREDLPPRLRSVRNVYTHHFSRTAIDEVWKRFLSALSPLRDAGKLGAVMLQFPKWFIPSRESGDALELARDRLRDWPASVEVRHQEWLTDRIAPRLFDVLTRLKFSYVCVDAPQGWESSVPPTMKVTNPELAIIRFHGRRTATWESRHDDVAERFRYLYSGEQLEGWLGTLTRTIDEARRVHLTYNNNKWNYAATNAVEMNAIMAGRLSAASA